VQAHDAWGVAIEQAAPEGRGKVAAAAAAVAGRSSDSICTRTRFYYCSTEARIFEYVLTSMAKAAHGCTRAHRATPNGSIAGAPSRWR
jgi:hypothetical protein